MIDSFNSEEEYQRLLQEVNEAQSVIQNSDLSIIEQAYIKKFASLWALKYKAIKNKPTVFNSKHNPYARRPWQIAILDDPHENIVVQKSRQLGLSETGMSKVLHFLDVNKNTKAVYTFPRDQQMKEFSNTRVKPALQAGEHMQSLISKDQDSVSLKKIGTSYLFMRSAWGSALGEGVDADFVAFDEYDRMKDNVELAFQESLKSSQYHLMSRWSTPTIPGRGVNRLYDISDKNQWFWTCPHCGTRQIITLEDNVVQIKSGFDPLVDDIPDDSYEIACSHCKLPLNRMEAEGIWVPSNPSRIEIKGYFISQLDAPWISPTDIMRRQKNYSSKQLFYNYVLGYPYASEGLIINEQDVRLAIKLNSATLSRTREYNLIIAGIDWGAVNWMVIIGIKGNGQIDLLDIYWFADNPFKPLEPVMHMAAILKAYQPNLIVADAGYGSDRNSYMYQQFPNALYSCKFLTVKNSQSSVKFINQWNDTAREVTVDKTTVVQRMLHTIKSQGINLYTWDEKIAMLTKHLKNVRIMDMEDGGQVYQIATRVGPDHLACALVYTLIGKDKLLNYNTNKNIGMEFI
jgi:hypothetical protein